MWTFHPTKMSNKVLVIGAINIDVTLFAQAPYNLHDSNVVKNHLSVGGVGANIARNLSALGSEVTLFAPIGSDPLFKWALSEIHDSGVNLVTLWQGFKSPGLYINVLDQQRDLFIGFNNVEPLDPTMKYFDELHDMFLRFDLIVLDANLSANALKQLSKLHRKGILACDAVSIEKAKRVFDILENIDYLKTNRQEFEYLLKLGFKPLLAKGLTTIVTDGKNPVTVYQGGKKYIFAVPNVANVQNVSGAGDAFFSGMLFSLIKGEDLNKQIDRAIEAANKVLESENNTLKGAIT